MRNFTLNFLSIEPEYFFINIYGKRKLNKHGNVECIYYEYLKISQNI